MSIVLSLVLIGAVAWLWRRVDRLEKELAHLRTRTPLGARIDDEIARSVTHAAAAGKAVPAAGPIAPPPARWRPSVDFEDLFGRRLPIWAGGVTLAVAGFFLVRWSIDAGLLTPPVRVALAGLFGLALIAAAETAYRWRERVADPRVAQALAGAGLATLYAAFYLAGTAYGLIGSTVAFLGLAAVTAAAIALSYRFGLPSAVLGLVGGFAAPALVGSEHANLPLLTVYLALVTVGLALTGRRQERAWLGIAALAAGLLWGGLLTSQGPVRSNDIAVIGGYLVVLGALVPALVSGGTGGAGRLVHVGAAALAALQLAVLVASRFGPLEWSLYLLLGAALAWFGWRQPAMREGSAVAAGIGVGLLAVWSAPGPLAFAIVSAVQAFIFAGVPLIQIARGHGRALDLVQPSGFALGCGAAALWHFGSPLPAAPQPAMALALLILAAIPAATLALARRGGEPSWVTGIRAAEVIAALLAFAAVAQVLSRDALGWAAALSAVVAAWRARGSTGIVAILALLSAAWALDPLFAWIEAGVAALFGTPLQSADLPTMRAVALYLVPAAVAGGAWASALVMGSRLRTAVMVAAETLAAIAGHIVFRHAFAAAAGTDFAANGVAERAVWQALLLGAGYLARDRGWPTVAWGFAGAALAHLAWFTLVLHNPLWSAQAVGAVPVINLLLPAYGVGLGGLLLLRRWLSVQAPLARWTIDGAIMVVIVLFALSELRQAFAGSLLAPGPIGQGEDLLRSLVGIALAAGFLAWGARTRERSWRIGSLLLMVVAVLKVFLVDAAGLAGLTRIASFVALGFSLIGIGWFYARQLRPPAAVN